MKNIGILGYGTVGRATEKYLNAPGERQFVAFDQVKDVAEAINRHKGVKAPSSEIPLDALIVCINGLHPWLHDSTAGKTFAISTACDLMAAIKDSGANLRESAPILVRTTVPPGTCEALQELFPNNSVIAWPEFSKEASMRAGYEIKAPYLGLSPKVFDEDAGNGHIIASMLLRNCDLHGEVASSHVYTNTEVEFLKLAWNVKRATDVTVFNELVRGAVSLGIDVPMAEHLVENARPSEPQFTTLAFGGKCLAKDLRMWDVGIGSNFGHAILNQNQRGAARALKMAYLAHEMMELPNRPVTILGLQDGPSSGACHSSPAMHFVGARKYQFPLVMVDSQKAMRDRFWWLLLKKGKASTVKMADPDSEADLSATNMIIMAQSSHGPTIYNSLLRVLKTSWEPIKIVVNACNMYLSQHQIIEASKWGAVFIDEVELDRMRRERDVANRLRQMDEEADAIKGN